MLHLPRHALEESNPYTNGFGDHLPSVGQGAYLSKNVLKCS